MATTAKGKNKGAARARGAKPNGRLTSEDLFVRRRSDGELVPIEVPVPGLGGKIIKVLPTTLGSLKGLTALDKDSTQWPLHEKIRYVTEHVVDPDLREVTSDEVMENMTLWDLDMLLVAAIQAGGSQRRKQQGNA